jgi:serine/threonine-protein kinase
MRACAASTVSNSATIGHNVATLGGTLIAGRYRLLERLGAGPMSEVWLAEDAELERPVALKLLARDADRARFDREARAAASLAHPNITQLYDYGEAEGRPYMVLEYLPGGTLEERLPSGAPLPEDEARRIAAALAAGLAHAHDRGLVHRDLKPSNVLFDAEGRPKIADFGIARLGAGEGTLTEAGTVLGTAAYISPEQAGGRRASPASDVYSFGVILFRLLTGRLPFEAAEPLELVALHRDATPPTVASVEPAAPADLAALADESLAKDPRRRPADGRALAAALGVGALTTSTTYGDGAADETQVLPAAAAPAPRARRRRVPIVAAAAAILAAAGVGLAFAVTHDSGPKADTFTLDTSVRTRKLPKLKTTPVAVVTHAQTTESRPTTHEQTTRATPTTWRTTTAAPATTAPLPTEPETTAPATTAPTTTADAVGTTTTTVP